MERGKCGQVSRHHQAVSDEHAGQGNPLASGGLLSLFDIFGRYHSGLDEHLGERKRTLYGDR